MNDSGVSVEVPGLTETIQRLQKLDFAVQNKILLQSLKIGGKTLLAAVISEAPVESGLTRSNIKMTTGRKGLTARVSVGLNEADYTGDTFYAAFLIYGHKVGSRKLGDTRAEVPANNFLKRAADKTSDAVIEETSAAMLDLIELECVAIAGPMPVVVWQGHRIFK